MKQFSLLLAGLCLLTVSGIGQRLLTDYWKLTDFHKGAALTMVSKSLGDWEGIDVEMDERQREAAGIEHYLQRRYVNRRTGAEILVLAVYGRRGPISVHPPEICSAARGYYRTHQQVPYEIKYATDEPPARFWTTVFRKDDGVAIERQRFFWGWNSTGNWEAPENPRVSYRRADLYKLYIIRQMAKENEPIDEDPALEFIPLLLQEFRRTLDFDRN